MTATGTGAARATVVNATAAPSAVVSGPLMNTVTVTWSPASFSNGTAVTTYTVRRYDATTGIAGIILTGCAGIIHATSCIETTVPPGQWRYTVTGVAGNWHAGESPKSTTVTTL